MFGHGEVMDAVLDHDAGGFRQRRLRTDHDGRRRHGVLHGDVGEVGAFQMLDEQFPRQPLRRVECLEVLAALLCESEQVRCRNHADAAICLVYHRYGGDVVGHQEIQGGFDRVVRRDGHGMKG